MTPIAPPAVTLPPDPSLPRDEADDPFVQAARDYDRIGRAIAWLVAHAEEQPGLDRLAAAMGMSPHHLQRLFTRWAGVSPKRFLGALTLTQARAALEAGASVLDAALEAGLSGPSRLHDLYVAHQGITPGQESSGGEGLEIAHGLHPTPYGPALVLLAPRGLCGLKFIDPDGPLPDADAALAEARTRWPKARLVAAPQRTGALLPALFPEVLADPAAAPPPPPLVVSGTAFQVQVWRALLAIPPGHLATYQQIARAIGHPRAVRAVGNAVGDNPISILIPCHRVIRASGALGGYRWGPLRKRAIQMREGALGAGLDEKA